MLFNILEVEHSGGKWFIEHFQEGHRNPNGPNPLIPNIQTFVKSILGYALYTKHICLSSIFATQISMTKFADNVDICLIINYYLNKLKRNK